VGRQPETPENANRISLMLSLRHEPGSLASVLGMFAAEGINLLKIESEPIPGRDFEFRFYIDIEGHPEDEKTGHILRSLERTCPEYRMLGYYNS
jgi:chorismate mutase/prephenate dehydratase